VCKRKKKESRKIEMEANRWKGREEKREKKNGDID
jgi:hypothetical protein